MQCMHAINLLPAGMVMRVYRALRLPAPRAGSGETQQLGFDIPWPIFAFTVSFSWPSA